jgi:hypothetical protein
LRGVSRGGGLASISACRSAPGPLAARARPARASTRSSGSRSRGLEHLFYQARDGRVRGRRLLERAQRHDSERERQDQAPELVDREHRIDASRLDPEPRRALERLDVRADHPPVALGDVRIAPRQHDRVDQEQVAAPARRPDQAARQRWRDLGHRLAGDRGSAAGRA